MNVATLINKLRRFDDARRYTTDGRQAVIYIPWREVESLRTRYHELRARDFHREPCSECGAPMDVPNDNKSCFVNCGDCERRYRDG